jgi:thymidylate synthase (FAD)
MIGSRRSFNGGAESFLGQEIGVLDKGYIKLVDYMGTDKTIVDAARVSYGKYPGEGAFDEVKDTRLINFLMRNGHTSPFEQCVLTFEVKAPIFVLREWHRYRTARLNEVSGRYTKLDNEVYTPSVQRIKGQDEKNKQGSAGELPLYAKEEFLFRHINQVADAFGNYRDALDVGVARELARIDLPLSTYSRMVWQMDLHNLFNFLKQRLSEGAQEEIRGYAHAIGLVVSQSFPVAWQAFLDHVLNAVTFSGTELQVLRNLLAGETNDLQSVLNLAGKLGIPFDGGKDGYKVDHQGTIEGAQEAGQDHKPAPVVVGKWAGKAVTTLDGSFFSSAKENNVERSQVKDLEGSQVAVGQEKG